MNILLLLIMSFLAPLTSQSTSPLSSKPKVFIIGLNKTGTTSLGDFLSLISYTRLGWHDFISRHLFHSYHTSNLPPLIEISKRYDAFEDIPWCFVYEEMARLYPDAKFVLTLRGNEETWLNSVDAHTKRRIWVGHKMIYGSLTLSSPSPSQLSSISPSGGNKPSDSKDAYLSIYRNHKHDVRSFFSDKPGQLLEIVIDDDGEKNREKLCEFLGKEGEGECMKGKGLPRSNSRDTWMNKDPFGVFWVWNWVVYWIEIVVVGAFYSKGGLTGGGRGLREL